MEDRSCPRCGGPLPPARPTGRPATWCSDRCKRGAYEERRAAANGAIAVKIVERKTVDEHGLTQCAHRVAASPAACRRVFNELAALTRDGNLVSDPKWEATLRAAQGLFDELLKAGDSTQHWPRGARCGLGR